MKTYFQKAFRSTNVIVGVFFSFIVATVLLHAAQITFSSGDIISASDMNANFTELYNKVSSLESQTATLSSENDTLESTLAEVSSKADANETEISGLNTVKIFDDTGAFLGYSLGTDEANNIEILTKKGYIYCINQDGKHVIHPQMNPDYLYFTELNGSGDCYTRCIESESWCKSKIVVMVLDGVATAYEFSGETETSITYNSDYGSNIGLRNQSEPLTPTWHNTIYPKMVETTFSATGVPESITPPLHFGASQ